LAESIDYLNRDESVSAELGSMGRRRYEEVFRNDRIAEGFVGALTRAGLI